MRLPVNHTLSLVLLAALSACGGGSKVEPLPPRAVNGPAADYPMVLGAPFKVGETTYTPEDKLNYDAVGFAVIGIDGGSAVSAAHKTLPLPSYVEVTALGSGKTALVRIERRGPLSDKLIELSPGASAQLGLAGEGSLPVRVRRVNPPEQERAMLRAGQRAADRMDTPKGLLEALTRKLGASSASPPVPTTAQAAVAKTLQAKPSATPKPRRGRANPVATPSPSAGSTPAPSQSAADASPPKPLGAQGSLLVQVGTFSNQPNARALATKLGGHVSPSGRLFRVRMGPFANRGEAEAALAEAKAAGYSDARIQRAE